MLKFNLLHNSHLQSSIIKYGRENFTFEILEFSNKENLNNQEKYWIDFYKSYNPKFGYNKTFGGEINYKKDIKLHDTLLESGHMSPFEHCARAMSDEEYFLFRRGKGVSNHELGISVSNPVVNHYKQDMGWCNNFKGWVSYRYLIENKK